MKNFPLQGRTLALLAVIVPMLALFIYVGLRSGPLAPVAVTVVTVQSQTVTPALFGIGTVEARYTYKIGPTFAGRVKNLAVHVGDQVSAGQVLGEMDPVDLDDRLRAQERVIKRAEAVLRESEARQTFAQSQARRYETLFAVRSTSEESLATKRHELLIAQAALDVAREELARTRTDHEGLMAQRSNLRLIAPGDGVVALRDAEPGTTVVAGQAILEIIDPTSLWVNVRFDQISASGLAAGLPARIVLRSHGDEVFEGRVLRVEPMADAVTEEILAKVVFEVIPQSMPPVGELAELTVDLAPLPAAPTIPNSAVRHEGKQIGVWQVIDDALHFTSIVPGASDLDGYMQVREGLKPGDRVVAYSEKALTARSRIDVVAHMPGVSQ